MKTEDLIAVLSKDAAATPLRPLRIGTALYGVIILCAAVFLAFAGIRDGLGAAFADPVVGSKTFLPFALCIAGVAAVLRLMRPESNGQIRLLVPALIALAAGVVLVAGGFVAQPSEVWFAELTAVSATECLGFIMLISVPALALSFGLLGQGASTRPALSGAVLGCAVSAGVTAGYSLYCVQDNPVFFVIWYGMANMIVTAIGALAGSRLLRW
jgi:hypothetical protein